eukprot:6816117-Prymnesium_polylepis.3
MRRSLVRSRQVAFSPHFFLPHNSVRLRTTRFPCFVGRHLSLLQGRTIHIGNVGVTKSDPRVEAAAGLQLSLEARRIQLEA